MIWCRRCAVGFEGDRRDLRGYPCWCCNDDRHLEWAPWLDYVDDHDSAHVYRNRAVRWPGMSPKEESLAERR